MTETLTIDPVTRIEGHLAIRLRTDSGRIAEAFCQGEMFRGFENILRGRSPLDAQQITQRICGVCPISHGTASILAQEQAYRIKPPDNGRLVRNLLLGANYLQSHIIHFYQLSALDFVDIAAVLKYTGADRAMQNLKAWVKKEVDSGSAYAAAPFLPRYDAGYIEDTELNNTAIKNYLTALEMRQLAHQMVAIFGAKVPHSTAMVPGGVTEHVTADKVVGYRSRLLKIKDFIENCYIPDVLAVAQAFPDYFAIGRSCGNYLAYGRLSGS